MNGDNAFRSLHELYGEKEQPWRERTEPIVRFWRVWRMLGLSVLL